MTKARRRKFLTIHLSSVGNPDHPLLGGIGHEFVGVSLSETQLFFVCLKNSGGLFWKEDPTFLA